MKASIVLFLCALSASASNIHRKHTDQSYRRASDYPSYQDAPNLPKYGYNKYYNEDNDATDKAKMKASGPGSAPKCLPKPALEAMVDKYISQFEGITDNGKAAKGIFDEDVRIFSQSQWWMTPGNEKNIERWAKADSFPPIIEGRDQLVRVNTFPNKPDLFKKGPVTYGCNTFSFFWKGDFSVDDVPTKGRAYGIDMVYLNPETGKVTKAFSEYNTLNQIYNAGAHVTWSDNPVCCECSPLEKTCKCPTT
ncbi:hypothetical protein ACJ41O_014109 [Fusarium nematophilum]